MICQSRVTSPPAEDEIHSMSQITSGFAEMFDQDYENRENHLKIGQKRLTAPRVIVLYKLDMYREIRRSLDISCH